MTELKKEFGIKLKKYRKEAGLSQEQLADKADITTQTLSGIENGYGFPSYSVLCKLIEALNIPAVCLFAFDNNNENINEEELKELFLENFRNLNPKNRAFILNSMEYLRKNQ